MKLKFGCILVLFTSLFRADLAAQETVTFIPFGGIWKYLDTGVDQGTNWVALDFDDSSWAVGAAELGYGDGDEATVINGGPANNRIPTTYFRTLLEISDVNTVAGLDLAVRRDDGIVVYLNGVEVFRDNMPNGPINFFTFAPTAQDDGNSVFTAQIPTGLLREGGNVVAAEVHQTGPDSSDVSFDLELTGLIAGGPPLIVRQPEPQTVFEGRDATFEVVAAGLAPLTYQWDVNGMPLPDATNATLMVTNATAEDEGVYRVVVANDEGIAVSAKVALTVITASSEFRDDFEPDIDLIQWLEFGGQVLATNYGGSVSGNNSLWFGEGEERSATTRPLDTRDGGIISFFIRLSGGTGNPWEQADLPGEGVVLEYSTDDGELWTELGRYDTVDLREWTSQAVVIPSEAQTSAVLFRWRQLSFSSDTLDHWALDDVLVLVGDSAPIIFRQPIDISTGISGTAIFEVLAGGTAPLEYQWFYNDQPLPGATNNVLRLDNVSTNDAGFYYAQVSNSLGTETSETVELSVLQVEDLLFQIAELTTEGAVAVEHNQVSQDDHGGVAITSTHVIYNGQNSIGRFNLDTLGNAADLGVQYNALLSDLKEGKMYTLAQGNQPIQTGGGTADRLIEVNSLTGQPTGDPIMLSAPIFLPQYFSTQIGFFHGFQRLAIYNGANVYSIYLPDGTVLDHGPLASFAANQCENGAFWGVAEYFDGQIHLAYVENSSVIVRRAIASNVRQEILSIQTFPSLSDMCAWTIAPYLGRWYFHHEGTSIFRGGDETIGYANALAIYDLPDTPPSILREPEDVVAVEGMDVTLSVQALGSLPFQYQWYFEGQLIPEQTGRELNLSNATVEQSGSYWAIVSNEFGEVMTRVTEVEIRASRGTIGYYLEVPPDFTPNVVPSMIQASFLPLQITNIATLDLSTIDILMLELLELSPSPALGNRLRDIESWVLEGGKVMSHVALFGENEGTTHPFLFGLPDALALPTELGDNVNLLLPDVLEFLMGPHGNLNALALDNGNPSYVGYVQRQTLPMLAKEFFNAGNDTNAVISLVYGLGEGFTYFSTMPLGFLTAQPGQPYDTFRQVYLPNLIEYMNDQEPAGTPAVLVQPTDHSVLAGAEVILRAAVQGAGPLMYQWYFEDAPIAEANTPLFAITNAVPANQGDYYFVASNASGSVTSEVAALTVTIPGGESFRITGLSTNDAQLVNLEELANGYLGGLAASSEQAFFNGPGPNFNGQTYRASLDTLTQARGTGQNWQSMVSNLRTETVYVLASGSTPMTEAGGLVTALIALDDGTGMMTSNRVELSRPINLPGQTGDVGIFSGYDRILLHTGSRVYHVELPSGEVVDGGLMNALQHSPSSTWAFWGVAEFYEERLYLVYARDFLNIVRTRVPDGVTTVVQRFQNLGTVGGVTVSPVLGRWYLGYQGSSQFDSSFGARVVTATATFEFEQAESPPEIRNQPSDQAVFAGGQATFRVTVVGTAPLTFQWQYEGEDLAGATNAILRLTDVQDNQAGLYSVRIANPLGMAESSPAELRVIRAEPFSIASMLTSNSQVTDHNELTGDDRGAIAISPTSVFYTGDGSTARFSADNLGNGAQVANGFRYDAIVSELSTETVYTLADGGEPLVYDGAPSASQVTSLIALDPNTGALTSRRIELTRPISVPLFEQMGFFAGVERIVLLFGQNVYSIEIPTGDVLELGSVVLSNFQSTENWGFTSLWGVAEMIDGVVHLAYVGFDPINFNPAIVRTSLADNSTSTISQFIDLSDMAVFTVSLSRNRWYFHYEGFGQFGGQSETVGYADAVFNFDGPPQFGTVPLLRLVNEDQSSGPIPFTVTDDTTPGDRLQFVGWSTNAALIGTNNVSFSGTGPEFNFEITPQPDAFGLTRVILQVTDESGNAAQAELTVSVRAVNDPPSMIPGPNVAAAPDSGPQTISGWATQVIAGPPNESSQNLTVQIMNDQPDLFVVQPNLSADGTLTFTPAAGMTGTAQVSVRLMDNGGTLFGGVDVSEEYVFEIVIGESGNRPPVLDPIPPQSAEVETTLVFMATASDPDEPEQSISFSLAPGAPNGAYIDPDTGTFFWRPGRADASSTNQIIVRVTDTGTPPMSDEAAVEVVVGDYLEVTVGTAIVLAGESASVPIEVTTTVSATNVEFFLEMVLDRLTNLSLEAPTSPIAVADLTLLTNGLYRLEFATEPGESLLGTQMVSRLHFDTVVGADSAFVPLKVDALQALQANGQVIERLLRTDGRVIYLGEGPLLEIVRETEDLVSPTELLLYTQPRENLLLESALPWLPPASPAWELYWEGGTSNLVEVFELGISNHLQIFRGQVP